MGEGSRKHGRPGRYCYKVHDKIIELVTAGLSREGAAYGAGINPGTLYKWMQYYPDFREDIKKADADFEQSIIGNIRLASVEGRTWQAGAWLLQHKHPQTYGLNPSPRPDPGDDKEEHWQLRTRISGKRYLVVDIGDTDPITAYHESKRNGDTTSQEPTDP